MGWSVNECCRGTCEVHTKGKPGVGISKRREIRAQRQSCHVAHRENKVTKLREVEEQRSLPSNYKPVSRLDSPGMLLLLLPHINIHQTAPGGALTFLSDEMTRWNIIYLLSSFIPLSKRAVLYCQRIVTLMKAEEKVIICKQVALHFTGCCPFILRLELRWKEPPCLNNVVDATVAVEDSW